MTISEYDDTTFYAGIQAKINGKWYPVEQANFESRSIETNGVEYSFMEIDCFTVSRGPNAEARRKRLIENLEEAQEDPDPEEGHFSGDMLLLEYLEDREIEKAFLMITRWYA